MDIKTGGLQSVKAIRVEHSASILLIRQFAAGIPESSAQSITDAAPDRCVQPYWVTRTHQNI